MAASRSIFLLGLVGLLAFVLILVLLGLLGSRIITANELEQVVDWSLIVQNRLCFLLLLLLLLLLFGTVDQMGGCLPGNDSLVLQEVR